MILLSLLVFLWSLIPLVVSLQGDSWCGDEMCVRAFQNGTQWTFQMRANLGENSFGWMAIGFGTSMTSANEMVIMWPNHDGSVTLSMRVATGHSQPQVLASPPRTATTYLQLSSQTSSETNLAFTVAPSGDPSVQRLIWAIATTRPPSGAVDAQLTQHIASGAISLDLTRTFSDNTQGTAVPTGPPGDNTYLPPFPTQTGSSHGFQLPPLLPYQKMLQAHAILCGIGFLVVLPMGALVARWGRPFTNSWFRFHWVIQFLIGLPIIVSGWFLGVAGVITKEGRHFDDKHKILGLSLLGAYILQLMIGAHIHFFKPNGVRQPRPLSVDGRSPNVIQLIFASGRPVLNYVHPFLGLTIIGFAFWQVWIGINVQWELATGRGSAPPITQKFWYAWIVILPCLYFLGLSLLPKQLSRERTQAELASKGPDAVPLKPSPPGSKKSLRGLKISAPLVINDEEEWKREDPMDQRNAQDILSEEGHHSMPPVAHAGKF